MISTRHPEDPGSVQVAKAQQKQLVSVPHGLSFATASTSASIVHLTVKVLLLDEVGVYLRSSTHVLLRSI